MPNSIPVKLSNLRMLQLIALKLGELRREVVFLGGCTTALFITDAAAPDVRSTLDVDCIVDIISLKAYHQLEKQLRLLGFRSLQDEVICRWRYDDVIVDIMPVDEKILGFSNRWYKEAIQHAVSRLLTDNLDIRVVTAPYFLATKLQAFKDRGQRDYFASHDLEDIIAVIEGRAEIIEEVAAADSKLRKYLATTFTKMNASRNFHDALPGHFAQYGSIADDRIDIFLDRLKQMMQLS